MATVVVTDDSAPRTPGAALAVNLSGEVVGSVSGGFSRGPSTALSGDGPPCVLHRASLVRTFSRQD
ncbi:XdhC family protein [Streptomyces sp. NPDC002346]